MRKLLIGATALVMMLAMTLPAMGDTTDTIEVTLDPSAEISISVDQATWTPTCGLGEENETATDWATITNDGEVNVTVNVKAEDSNDWTIESAEGHDQFVLRMYIGSSWTALTDEDQIFTEDFPPYAGADTIDFGLNVTMPTTSSTSQSQSVTITFTASASA